MAGLNEVATAPEIHSSKSERTLTRPKKIVGIASFMNSGGAQEAILRVSRQMRNRGYDMEVWFLYEVKGTHHGPYVRVLIPKNKLSLWEYALCFMKLVRDLRATRVDALIMFLPLGNVFGGIAGLLAGIPLRIASHRSPGTSYGWIIRKLDRACGWLGVFSKMVCVSNAVKESFNGYPGRYTRRLIVVHNGIEWHPSSLSRPEARASLKLHTDEFIISAAGRLEDQKNYPFLLDVIASVQGVRLVIAGDGSQKDQLLAQGRKLGISDRLDLVGHLPRSRMVDLLRASDVFVQASKYEGQSNAVLEAMHEGLPIVVSDIPEQRETVVDETNGEAAAILAPLDNLNAWTAAVERLRDDRDLRMSLGGAAQAMVARRFGLKRMTDRFEAVLAGSEVS